MKIIDNNGRLFGKISIIDVVVLLVAAFLAVALYLKTNTMTHTSTTPTYETVTYTVICNAIPGFVEGQIRVGDHIFDADNTKVGSLGEIIDIQYEPGTEMTRFEDGTVTFAPVEDSVNILLTIRGSGISAGNGFMFNRVYPLGVNANRNFCTRYTCIRGIVSSMEK